MDVQYSAEIQQHPEELRLLKQASVLLDDIPGPQSSQRVKAEWGRLQDRKGRTLYRLTIRDFTGQVSTDFAPDELQNPLHLRVRLYRLWGDLLKVQNDQQHELVQTISGQIASGQEGH